MSERLPKRGMGGEGERSRAGRRTRAGESGGPDETTPRVRPIRGAQPDAAEESPPANGERDERMQHAVEAARRGPGQVVVGTGEDDEETDGPPPEWKRFALGAALTLAYVAGLAFAGFLIATPLFIAALCRLIGTRSLVRDAAVGVALAVAAWLLFVKVLAVGLP